jgi:HlyD family secretion protein
MATPRKRKSSIWIWLSAAAALIVVFYFVRMATRTRVPVRVATVVRSELRRTIPTNGKVEPQVNFEAHAPFAGQVKAIYVQEGQRVTPGTLLLSLDDTDARARLAAALSALKTAQGSYTAVAQGGTQEERLSLQSDMVKAQIDRDQAQHDLDALRKLQLSGAASAGEVASAQQRLETSNATLTALQQRKTERYDSGDLARARAALADAQAGYAAAQEVMNQANIRAPFAGTVYAIPVSKTEYVQQGDMLLEVANLSKMQVRAYFDEPEVGKLHVGQPITIQWDARPDKTWHGHITRVPSTIITYTTRNVGEVLVTIDDADSDLLPDTNVLVTALVANEPDALNIPHEALHSGAGSSYVYLVKNGILRRTTVTVGNINLTQVEILSGLKEGDVVALGSTNGQPIGDGVAISEAN